MDKKTVDTPSMRGRVSRLMMGGTLAVTMGLGSLATPMMALAVDTVYDEASFTITQQDNADAQYKVFELFRANISPASSEAAAPIDGVATHLQWGPNVGSTQQSGIINLLKAHGYEDFIEGLGQDKTDNNVLYNPQNAAEFIGQKIAAGPWDADAGVTPQSPAAASFANQLAKLLVVGDSTNNVPAVTPSGTATSGTAFTGEEGYYLFVTSPSSIGVDEAGTAAAWVPLGGKTSSITEKTAIPSVSKEVKEDSSAEFGKAADANKGQSLDYKITGVVPDNIGSFTRYQMTFTDTLPAGMTLEGGNTGSVVVKMDGKDVTAAIGASNITYSDNVLTVNIADILDATAFAGVDGWAKPEKASEVTVEYKAQLNENAVIGLGGDETNPLYNQNSCTLTYTNDPIALGTRTTHSETTNTFTYQLDIEKIDKVTHVALSGAKFTMQVAQGNSDTASVGKYVQADGSLGDQPYEFTTNAEGKFSVPRIDEGTYTLHETAAPQGYELENHDITVVVTSELDTDTGALTDFEATVSGGETASDGETPNAIYTHLVATSLEDGNVSVQTSDDKQLDMPITGQQGILLITLAGIGIVTISLAGFYRNRKRNSTLA